MSRALQVIQDAAAVATILGFPVLLGVLAYAIIIPV